MSLNVVDLFVVGSLIVMDVYGFYVLRKAHKEIDSINAMKAKAEADAMQIIGDLNKKVNLILDEVNQKIADGFGGMMESKEMIDETILQARDMLNPSVAVEIGEGIVLSSLQTLGMSNLKELGAKGKVVQNAKQGLNVVGNEIAKGAGVNELLEKFSPVVQKLEQGSGMIEGLQDNPLVQVGMALFGGGMGQAPGAGPPRQVQGKQLTQELKK